MFDVGTITSNHNSLDSKTKPNVQSTLERGYPQASNSAAWITTTIAPVAWIIIAGEGLHNTIDGISIGAAFSDSFIQGVSLSMAIVLEELPHKLGDFAIMIGAGMPFKMALACNLISSCFIYVGAVIGICLGELDANVWIYSFAAGMFIYIAVCDMLPELAEMGLEIEKIDLSEIVDDNKGLASTDQEVDKITMRLKVRNMLIQNIGIFLGVAVMALLAFFSKHIQFQK